MILRKIWDKSTDKNRVSRLLIKGDETETMALGYNSREKDAACAMDFHDDEEEFYIILKGSGRLFIGDEEEEVGPGCVAYVPRNTRHKMICISEEKLEYLFVANWPGEEIKKQY